MALEDLEKKLYNQKSPEESDLKKRAEISADLKTDKDKSNESLQDVKSWHDEKKENSSKMPNIFMKIGQIGKWLFWILLIVVLGLAALSGLYLYDYFSTDREVILSASAPSSVMVGVPFELMINFDNSSQDILKDADFSIFLPEGTAIIGQGADKRTFSKKIGDIEAGLGFQEKINLIALGSNEAVRNFNISFSYSSVLKSRFEKKRNVEVLAREPGIKLDLTTPEKVLNNEEFETKIRYENVSDINIEEANLKIILPPNFSIKEIKPADFFGKNLDNLAINGLKKSQSGEIYLKGKIIGPEQSFFEVKAQIEVGFSSNIYLISEKTASISIAPSPLSLAISLNESPNYVAYPNGILKYKLTYKNNTDVGLSDVVIKAKLSGEMFDFSSLKTTGSFDSRDSTLSWSAANVSQLRLLPTNEYGSVDLEIKTKPDYPIKRLNDKNFILKVDAEISSPTVPYYVAADKTIGLTNLETKIGGRIIIEPQVYFNDSSLGVSNKGVLPPKINQPINFTIHWIIKNYSTDVKDVSVKAYLQPGVRLTGIIKSNIETVPTYNERTQEINWLIPKIAATKGAIRIPAEAIFQIEALPNITQAGREMPLVGQTEIRAIDEFTNSELIYMAESLTTRSLKDSGFDFRNALVIQ
ncbi:MAG: hypothetical protein AAB596_00045 [Patescibacteria group bacterium]